MLFTRSIFIITYCTLSLSLRETRSFVLPLFFSHHGASPPPVGNHAETRRGLGRLRQRGYRRVAGVSAHRSDAAATRKHVGSLRKLTSCPCPQARPADAHRIIVNKIRNELISSIKIASPHRNHRNRSHNVRRLHLPLKLEPLEAGGLWRSWCRCFFVFLCVCVGGLWSKRAEERALLLCCSQQD